MKTPIFDFISSYRDFSPTRLHMPGHKGKGEIESFDITEISGADSLYEAGGIIRESEENASRLFGAHTFYSAEGSSLSIRAMLYLVNLYLQKEGKKRKILAGRNAHKSFVSGAALLDFEVEWIYPESDESYLSPQITGEKIEEILASSDELPVALYLTSPDYLGGVVDIESISRICKKYGVLLLVDNSHGAYLKFLSPSRHPIDLGADICTDSAHKTLPVLTGGGYLHISKSAPDVFTKNAKAALSLFGSTSPSYLILCSLDRANAYIEDGYREALSAFAKRLLDIKKKLSASGYTLFGEEPMKLTIATKSYGYLGYELAKILEGEGIIPEFADPDFLVLMPSVNTSDFELERLLFVLTKIERREKIVAPPPAFSAPVRKMPLREAALAPSERVKTEGALGRTLGAVSVGCPPAVPVLVCGELVDESAIRCFLYYGIDEIFVTEG